MTSAPQYPLLSAINNPPELRRLREGKLPQLTKELRAFLIDSVSKTGGHLAASLGTVELTVALHYVFDTPHDRLVWDVGHQAYGHKILTDRRDRMGTLRKAGGLSGFLKRSESEYDAFGAGHSSTSISAALGMAVAAAREKSERQTVAIIGDGALTAGMAYEALNNAGSLNANLLVILNDNDMSISPNVGAMSNYLARILSSKFYTGMRNSSKNLLSKNRWMSDMARRAEEHLKGMIMPGTLFEELGFNYIGPIDGHDLKVLVNTLRNMRRLKGPRFLHIATRKGKGYKPAEGDPCVYHGVTPFNPVDGKMEKKSGGISYTQVFSDWLCDMAERDERLIGITPAMREGSGLVKFSEQFPDRYFDVGIAEQHAVTFAAGLACEGLKPVVAIYSTFLQRAYDQLIHDVCIQNLPVLFAIDRAGLVGADGATHAGTFDYAFLRCLPNIIVMAPADENECRQMLYTGFMQDMPAAIRYPRGTGTGTRINFNMTTLPIGRAEIRRKGSRVAILAFGSMVQPALDAGELLDATVINMRFIKPMDKTLVRQMAATHELIVTVEENTILGGAGSGVSECLAEAGLNTNTLHLGLPDRYLNHGNPTQMLAECGLDSKGIYKRVSSELSSELAPVSETA